MNVIRSVVLHCTAGGSDKLYALDLVDGGDGTFAVNYGNGRRGSTLSTGTKVSGVSEAKAIATYEKVMGEKLKKGYRAISGTDHDSGTTAPVIAVMEARRTDFAPQLANPVDERDIDGLIESSSWVAQEKFDGERRGVIVLGCGSIIGANRKGLSVALGDELLAALANVPADTILDAEHVGDQLHVFDVLRWNGIDATSGSVQHRVAILDSLARICPAGGPVNIAKTAESAEAKRALLDDVRARAGEGLVFKHRASTYRDGRPGLGGDWLKFKFYKTLSAIVSSQNDQRSVALELLDPSGGTVPVGNVAIPSNHPVPSQGAVVEVRYLYAYEGGSLYQPVYLGVRSDIDPSECLASQRAFKAAEPIAA